MATQDPKIYTHQVLNGRTGQVVGNYQSLNAARTGRDKYDSKYGSYVHTIKPLATPGSDK